MQTNTVEIDVTYLKTRRGLLQLAAVVLSLIYFLVVVCVPTIGTYTSTYNWGAMVSSVSFLVSGGFLIGNSLHVITNGRALRLCFLIETAFSALSAFTYMTTAIDMLVHYPINGIIGLLALLVYTVDAIIRCMDAKKVIQDLQEGTRSESVSV